MLKPSPRPKARAIGSDDKAARRADILAAARQLFLEDSRQLPSAARIAEAASLAKGTVYLYFRTKEEIFIALLAEDFAGLLAEVHSGFSDAGQPDLLERFIQRYVAYLQARPELLRLDAMAYSVLEQNLDISQLRQFKLDLTAGLVNAGQLLDTTLQLAAGRGTTLLIRTYALTRGLWQSLDYPPNVRALLADPVFAPIRPEFQSELVQSLREYWHGAVTLQR